MMNVHPCSPEHSPARCINRDHKGERDQCFLAEMTEWQREDILERRIYKTRA